MAYLIDEKYLTENTSVSSNKNAKDIKVAFQLVTLLYVKPLLGQPLYELYENTTSLNPRQKELLEQVRYYMALKVERELMLNLLTLSNKGATEEDKAASLEVVKLKRQDVESSAAAMRKGLLAFLEEHATDFPEYYPEVKSVDYSAGIVLDTPRKQYYQ